jgi:transposase-like protein
MQAPRKIRASNHRPEPGGLSRYLPDAAALSKPFREYAIAAKIGCTPQTLRDWVRKAEVGSGQRIVGRLPVMAPSSQELEPLANPARFNPKFQTSLLFRVRQHL